MNLDSPFFKTLSIIADALAIATVMSAIPFALLRKNESLLAFKVSNFLHYMLRTAICMAATFFVYRLSVLLYATTLVLLDADTSERHFIWEDRRELSHLFAYFISITFGLSILWIFVSFIWTSSLNSTKEFFNLFLPKHKLLIKQKFSLEILSAVYKTDKKQIDVTPIVRQRVSENSLTIRASNELAGDPDPGIVKSLIIYYRIGQKERQITANEGDTITIPEQ